MGRVRATPSALVTLSALCAATAACAGSGPPRAVPEDVPAISAQARELLLPLDAYVLRTLDIHTIEAAEDRLIADCMRKQGMDWTLLPASAAEDPAPLNRRRYGVIEPAIAARYGYHIPPPLPVLARREEAWAARKELARRKQLAAYGKDGVGGCWLWAHEYLERGIGPYPAALYNKYAKQAFEAGQRAPRVVAVIREWEACMKRAGHSYADPFRAAEDPAWARSSRPSPRELSVARADVRCKEQTGLVTTWAAAEKDIQNDIVADNAADFRKLKDTRERLLRAACETLRPSGEGCSPSPTRA
ncbi:hypothetical protein [Nonomuraea sp. KM90]|uniref:hypothetical protein n=1 Tax=Nonomuraea sp. KM90 TaxID=3457428 RepID=UPI003FCE17C0